MAHSPTPAAPGTPAGPAAPEIPFGAPLPGASAGSPDVSATDSSAEATPDWPPWSGPLALIAALGIALVGSIVIDIPAAGFGVKISGNLPPGLQIADTVVQDVGFVAAAVILAGWAGRVVTPSQFGLRPVAFWRGVVGVVALYGAFIVFELIWVAVLNLHGKEKLLDQLGANHNSLLLVSSAALTCVIAPISEEFLFRGYIFTALRNWRGPLTAAVLTGLLFGGVHALSAPVAYLVPLAALGFGLCILYWQTRSLYPCIAAHCINNAFAFGALENWSWQIPVLAVSSLATIGLLFWWASRAGLLRSTPVLTAGWRA